MTVSKSFSFTLNATAAIALASVAMAAASATAQTATSAPTAAAPTTTAPAPAVTVGSAVVDASGAPVGTVASVKDGNAVVKTDKYPVAIPVSSFASSNGKLAIGSTQAQLNADYEKALAAAQASIVVGTKVSGPNGESVGTIGAIDSASATIKLTDGSAVRVERSAVAPGNDGAVIGATPAQLKQLAEQAKKPAK